MADNPKKKIAIVSVCSLLLVAMVVALFTTRHGNGNTDGEQDVSASQKSIQTLCQNTDYQETCVNSLTSSGSNSSDPKELIEIAFQAAIKQIRDAANNSTVFHEVEKDPRGKEALESCRELADRAINDLQRSFDKFNNFDITDVENILADLKIWLSGAITYQETCIDGFEEVPGDATEKMKELLKTGMEMTSNGLAMVTGISSVLQSIGGLGSYTTTSRRLLSNNDIIQIIGNSDDEMPGWIDSNRRNLLRSSKKKIKPNLVVAKDGSGNYTTVNEALRNIVNIIDKKNNKTFVLYIKEGVYEEKVVVNSSLTNLMFLGDGPTKTKITGRLNFIDGTNTYQTATVAIQGDHFIARDIGFENSAGAEKHQAVALRVSADMVIFYNCQMDGYQDTLYAHTYRQFYRDCVISGTIDFIFGDSAAVFQGCSLVVRKPLDNQDCIVTAQGRKDLRQPTGLVLQNCSFVPDPAYYPVRNTNKAYLGRPWKEFSRTIIMESYISDSFQAAGWLPWFEDFALDTLFYAEFNNRGPSSNKTDRVKWHGIKELPAKRVKRFTADEFLDGERWIPRTKVPYDGGFIFPLPKKDPNVKYSPQEPEETKDLGQAKDKSSFVRKDPPPPSPKKDDDGDHDDHHRHHHDSPKSSHNDSPASVPVSQIAASPWMEPYAPAPTTNFHASAPALSPAASLQPKENLSSFQKMFSGIW
ncbi:hypothetical protein ABFS82_02G095700 [Erythranthe guttata]|uniref:Pectinesterase n=1 Tax=Erythranthe guttata TaxID=4155 RepID=A0A022RC18_ERYGU|nr:PREDICTED: probable pectinesterase/pectinesterase inhibitor 58 [Erythranthe guttata]EYU37278.1 hypothetical protein MIMGU_mgv1a002232mg [Erythranthe guttata]|eukprot:XP_012837711.1 PREDICTED: probable pectinesterase/pectinesterase inhibitor 58 [Erythranthe guttata]